MTAVSAAGTSLSSQPNRRSIAGSSADATTERAIQTLLRNFDSFNMLSEEEDKSTGNWVEGQLIGEDLLGDDDSCSYSV